MTTLNDIEQALQTLSPQDLAEFREWYARFDAEQWDRQFEADAVAGGTALDALADEALRDLRDGKCTEL